MPEKEQFLDLAQRGKNEWWRYFISWMLILFVVVVSNILVFLLLFLPQMLRSGGMLALDDLEPVSVLVASLLPFVFLFGLMWGIARWIHKRPFLTLITPEQKFNWKRFFQGALIWGFLIAMTSLVEALLYPGRYRIDFNLIPFLKFLPIVILLIPFQTSAEELVFRGYLPQSLALLTRKTFIPIIISNVFFMLLHLANPEVSSGPVLTTAYYFGIGLFLAIITIRDNRMELAIGVHMATNLFVSLFVNTENSALQTPAVFMVSEMDALYNLLSFLIAAGVFYWVVFKFLQREDQADGQSPSVISQDA